MSNINLDFKKYISDNEESEKTIFDVLTKNKGEITLIDAPTGAGKTFTIFKVEKTLSNNYICFNLFPNKPQAIQNEKEYGIKSITEGTTIFRDNCITKNSAMNRLYSQVYDKATEICELFENDIYINILKNYNICLIVDECHELLCSTEYRNSCLESIFKCISYVQKNKGNIILMSATIGVMSYLYTFDNVVYFNKINYTSNVKNIIIKENTDGHRFEDFICGELKNEINTTHNSVFARYNSISKTSVLVSRLSEKGLKVENIDSTKKSYLKEQERFENRHYGSIIEKSFLDTNSFDILFTTSLFDEGTSIKTVSKKNITLFIIFEREYSVEFDKIIQFLNRFRFSIDKCVILMNTNKKPTSKFKTLKELISKEIKLFSQKKDLYEKSYKELLNNADSFKRVLEFMNIQKKLENANNVFYLDDDNKLKGKMNIPLYIAYRKYNKQYYYNREELKNQLQSTLKNNVCFDTNCYFDETEKKKKTYKENRKEQKEQFLQAVESAQSLLESKDTTYFKKLNASEKNELNKILNSDKKININEVSENHINVKNILSIKEIYKFMRIGIKYVTLKTLLEHLAKSKNKKEFTDYVLSLQFRFKNERYLVNEKSDTVKLSYEQKALLDKYCKFDKDNKFIPTELSDKDIYNLSQELELNTKEIYKLFKTIFVCDSHHTNKRILGIKLLDNYELYSFGDTAF